MKLPPLTSGGLIPTYCCSSACAHCLYGCHPGRDRTYIDRTTADRCFEVVSRQGCRVMHIGGGEPFLRPDALYQVLESAEDAGIHIEYVETNSSWYHGRDRAASILGEIKARGVDTLLLSISPFHNAHIPFGKVSGLMQACAANGVGVFPWTAAMLPEIEAMEPDTIHSLDEYRERYGEGFVLDAMQRYGVVPGGTALKTLAAMAPKRSLDAVLSDAPPCSRLLSTTHFHVDLYENYVPCLCPGLSIALDDLGTDLDYGRYPLLHVLVETGVRGLLDVAVAEYGFEPAPEGYVHGCELCHTIRASLVQDGGRHLAELQPAAFYD
jgi:hypothetical protein